MTNHLGNCIRGIAKPTIYSLALIAECEAVLEGLNLDHDMQINKVIISSDSKKVMDSIKNPLSPGG